MPINGKYVCPLIKVLKSKFKAEKELKIIKKLSMHVACHTFASLSNQANILLGTIQQLLVQGDTTTNKIYAESIRR